MKKNNKHRGSSFDEFLKSENLLDECILEANKKIGQFFDLLLRMDKKKNPQLYVPSKPNQKP